MQNYLFMTVIHITGTKQCNVTIIIYAKIAFPQVTLAKTEMCGVIFIDYHWLLDQLSLIQLQVRE